MPLRNRVDPWGEPHAVEARGLLFGNRGVLHDASGAIGRRRWSVRRWIACELRFKGRRRPLLRPGRFTELFFLDEAVALAAGHRPCAECRLADYRRYTAAWATALGGSPPRADPMDDALHAARLLPGTRERCLDPGELAQMPLGAMVVLPDQPRQAWLVLEDRLLAWSHAGYGAPLPRPTQLAVRSLTPRPSLAALRAGYRPRLHPSAG